MKKNQLLYASLIVLGGIIFACSGEETENKAKTEFKDVVALPGEDTTAREQGEFDRKSSIFTAANIKKIRSVQKKHKYVTHVSKTKSGLLFIKQSKKDLYTANSTFDKKVRFALLDEKGAELLPMTCEQISNPGFTVHEYVEYKVDGKYGLYNYDKKEKIDAKYDLIYPSKIMEYVAIGERNGNLYKIYADGKEKVLSEDENGPNYYNLIKDFRYNYASKFFAWWYNLEMMDYYEEDSEYAYELAMIMPPSYISKLDVVPGLVSNIVIGSDTTDLSPAKQVKRNENVTAITTNFYQYFAESRGYNEKSQRLTTIGKKNKIKETVVLYSYDEYEEPQNEKYNPQVVFLNDSLVEVRNYVINDNEQEYFSFMPYAAYTKYEYYSIGSDGTISRIGQGTYPMISAIPLSRAHFKGEFKRWLTEFELIERGFNPEELYGNGQLLTDHLSASDLEFMINELYAYKGMKFTETELTNYFSQFSWYKPKYKNVDSKLTEIEKKNVKMIKNLIKDLKSNPGKFIHEEASQYVEAG